MISIAGIFYYSKSNIVLDIFSELVMNNNYVSKYLKIDENDKLNKKRVNYICIIEMKKVKIY